MISRVVLSSSLIRPGDTDPYAANDGVSAVTTDAHFTFSDATYGGPTTGTIDTIFLHSSAAVATKLACELWLFDTDFTSIADNAAFAPSDAEMLTLIGIVDFAAASWKAGTVTAGAGGNAVVIAQPELDFVLPGTRAIYGQLRATAAYTPVASETFTVQLVISR